MVYINTQFLTILTLTLFTKICLAEFIIFSLQDSSVQKIFARPFNQGLMIARIIPHD